MRRQHVGRVQGLDLETKMVSASPFRTARQAKRRRQREANRLAELLAADGQTSARKPSAAAIRQATLKNRRARRRAGLSRPMPTDVTMDKVDLTMFLGAPIFQQAAAKRRSQRRGLAR